MNKKILKKVLIIIIPILLVIFVVINNVGITLHVSEVMPDFRFNIYSDANLIPYNINYVKSAKNELTKQLDKVRNIELNDNQYLEQGLKKILLLNEKTITDYIASYSEATYKKYQELPECDYLSYIKDSELNYSDKYRQNDLSMNIIISSFEDNDLYYTVKASTYKPIKVKKSELDNLQVNDILKVDFPIATTSEVSDVEKVDLIYEGDKKFKYVTMIDTYNQETGEIAPTEEVISITFKDLDKNNYVMYETETRRIEVFDKVINLNILKNANTGYGYGPNFLYLANIILLDERKDSNLNPIIKMEDLIKQYKEYYDENTKNIKDENLLEEFKKFAEEFNAMYVNYFVYDKKGYVTDMYIFGD